MDLAARGRIVGRLAELSGLDRLVAGVAEGRGGLGWVQGEPGIGKSALIDAVLARASTLGCAVLRGAGDELMEAFPLRLMADCLGISARSAEPLRAQIAALLRGESIGSAAVDPVLAAGERMLELVDRLCALGPVVLAAEDLQWADEPSLLVWNRLARAVDQIPLLLIGATRPLPHRVKLDRLRELVAQRAGVVLDLGPLDPESVAELAGRIAKGVPGPRLRTALVRAGGNPLYVRELVDALVRDGLVAVSAGTAELHGDVGATPASLTVAIGSRLGFVSEDTRKTLRMAALMGNEFDAGEWAAITSRSAVQVADTLADAVAGGVISGIGDRLRFRHQLIHQVLVEQTPAAMRRALHAEFARTLAQAGAGADSVARHLLAVPGRIDEWVLGWLAATPESALYALPQVFAELLGRAVESAGEESQHWEVLATRLAQVLFWLGRDAQAGTIAAALVRQTDDVALASRMRIQIIRSAGRMGHSQDGLPVTVHSPEDDGLPPLWRARLGAWSALLLYTDARHDESAVLARDALERAIVSRDPLTIAYARHAVAACCGAASRAAHIEAGLAALTGEDPESMDLRLLLLANYVTLLGFLGRREEAETALPQALLLADRVGTYRGAMIVATAADFCYRYGRWDEALVHLASIDREFLDTGHFIPEQGLTALIALHREDRDSAETQLRATCEAVPEVLADPPVPLFPLTQALALRAEADGDLARAVTLMSAWLSVPLGVRVEDRQDYMPDLVRLALAAGDAATAEAAAAMCQADAVADGSPGPFAAAAFCRALIKDDADGLLAVAADYRGYGWLPQAAFALEEAAVRLAAAGDIARARSALTGAVRIHTELGATWDIRRADARLRPYGIRRGSRSIHRRATTGWAALTPSEARITGLVAQGLSNPDIATKLFLSRETVQTHVSNILAKLQVRSRIDIVRAAAQQQAAAGPGPLGPYPAAPGEHR